MYALHAYSCTKINKFQKNTAIVKLKTFCMSPNELRGFDKLMARYYIWNILLHFTWGCCTNLMLNNFQVRLPQNPVQKVSWFYNMNVIITDNYLLFFFLWNPYFLSDYETKITIKILGWFMVVNTTCNNISVISWRSVLLVEETGVRWEKPLTCRCHWQTL